MKKTETNIINDEIDNTSNESMEFWAKNSYEKIVNNIKSTIESIISQPKKVFNKIKDITKKEERSVLDSMNSLDEIGKLYEESSMYTIVQDKNTWNPIYWKEFYELVIQWETNNIMSTDEQDSRNIKLFIKRAEELEVRKSYIRYHPDSINTLGELKDIYDDLTMYTLVQDKNTWNPIYWKQFYKLVRQWKTDNIIITIEEENEFIKWFIKRTEELEVRKSYTRYHPDFINNLGELKSIYEDLTMYTLVKDKNNWRPIHWENFCELIKQWKKDNITHTIKEESKYIKLFIESTERNLKR